MSEPDFSNSGLSFPTGQPSGSDGVDALCWLPSCDAATCDTVCTLCYVTCPVCYLCVTNCDICLTICTTCSNPCAQRGTCIS
jgi:hypothetical protein